MKKHLFIIFALSPALSFGQVDKSLEPPFIEVTGTASKEVVPDKIYISIILSDKVVDHKQYTIDLQEQKLRNALVKSKIDPANLSLADAGSEIIKDKKREIGFKLTKEFVLQVKNSDEVTSVFKELYAINIKESSILKTEHSKIDSLRKEVRIAAIKAAKAKAEYLAAAIDEQIGKPVEIREQEDIPYYRENTSNSTLNSRPNEASDKAVETNFKKFTIKFSYYIKYSIK